jgi:hypothetical protein
MFQPRKARYFNGFIEVIAVDSESLCAFFTFKINPKNYPGLKNGTVEQLSNIEISPFGLHWPDLNEDLSIAGIVKNYIDGGNQN